MTKESKAREFWVGYITECLDRGMDLPQIFVTKQAYQQLEEKLRVAVEAIKRAQIGLDLYGSCTLPPHDVSGRRMFLEAGEIRIETRLALKTIRGEK